MAKKKEEKKVEKKPAPVAKPIPVKAEPVKSVKQQLVEKIEAQQIGRYKLNPNDLIAICNELKK